MNLLAYLDCESWDARKRRARSEKFASISVALISCLLTNAIETFGTLSITGNPQLSEDNVRYMVLVFPHDGIKRAAQRTGCCSFWNSCWERYKESDQLTNDWTVWPFGRLSDFSSSTWPIAMTNKLVFSSVVEKGWISTSLSNSCRAISHISKTSLLHFKGEIPAAELLAEVSERLRERFGFEHSSGCAWSSACSCALWPPSLFTSEEKMLYGSEAASLKMVVS